MNLLKYFPSAWKERLRRRAGVITLLQRLETLRRAGYRPHRIIDAGAFEGEWTRTVRRVFPETEVLMVEPQPEREPALSAVIRELPGVRWRRALLGAGPGTARFLVEATNSRVLTGDWTPPAGSRVVELPIETLADLSQQEDFSDCDFIKLDLQGHELQALAGAGELFGRCEVFQVEVSWLRIGEVPLAHEVIARFVERDYVLYDVLGHNYRPLDGALWQTDFIFVRSNSPLVASRMWG